MASQSSKVVYAALAGNFLVAITKAMAAFWTGSSAMRSEAVHSFVDTGNEALLLYGIRRSQQRPDSTHPLGYGRELYFWSFIVALLVFALGAGVSFYQGVVHLRSPHPIERPLINYVVLGLCFLFEGGSWWIALRTVRASKGKQSYWQAVVRSKDPPQFMVLLEDTAALIGIILALAGTWASVEFHEPRFDGLASLAIALLLATMSVVLARESKALLIGERADPEIYEAIARTASRMAGVVSVNGLLTTQLSPQDVVAALSLEFEDDLRVEQVERIVEALEDAVRREHPEITSLFVKPQTKRAYQNSRLRLLCGQNAPAEDAQETASPAG
jgi:cation diffusion facilitator family transporter